MFGFNIYIAQTSEFEAVSEGSAVIAQRCEAYELAEGRLVLYMRDDEPALGYVDSIEMNDGIYSVTVSDSSGQYSFEETSLIGSADLCSPALGAVIRFSQSTAGICVIAVLPCLALIIYDIIRAIAAKLPPPEVVPRVKNARDDTPETTPTISVNSDGRALISNHAPTKPVSGADSVLFSYAGRQRGSAKPDIIPLSKPIVPPADKFAADKLSEKFSEKRPDTAAEKSVTEKFVLDRAAMEAAEEAEPVHRNPAAIKPSQSAAPAGTPAPVAARRYLDNVTQPAAKVSGGTAEIPILPKKTKNDAFFAQSEVPQIGRKSRIAPRITNENVSADTERSHGEISGRRSSVILSQISRDELISEDDDSLDKSRYEIDDILAGLERQRKQ